MEAKVRNFRLIAPILIAAPLFFLLLNCTQESTGPYTVNGTQRIRVRLLESVDRITMAATANPHANFDSSPGDRTLGLTKGAGVPISLVGNAWRIGSANLPGGNMNLTTDSPDGIRINGTAYRGKINFIPLGDGKFDVVNDVALDDYLKGVVTREMYAKWHPEALKAQAIVARTYALYEAKSGGMSRYWDVYGDERSQMYGGIDGESPQGRAAVDATLGIVATYGSGNGHIFKTYFSSCCGGVAQSASDAFPGDPYIPPLSERMVGNAGSASKYFNWGPVTLTKAEITRRIQVWATRRSAAEGRKTPESKITNVSEISVAAANRFGRPNRVLITDSFGTPYSFSAEEMRSALNTDPGLEPTLPSSFCKIKNDPDTITFYDGHGYGHGVGMCQYTAEAWAAAGQSCAQILAASYPQSKLVRAY